MKVGYARVSTQDQSLDLQMDALKAAGCEKVFTEKASDGAAADRAQLTAALEFARAGDVLVVWKLDRLGRTSRRLVELVHQLRDKGIEFQSCTDGIDTTTAMGRFFFVVMAALAEMERELIMERTRAGLAAAKARGRNGGRKPLDPAIIETLRILASSGQKTPAQICKELKISRATFYKYLAIGDAT
ncbi:MAG: recombinase family protein [Rhodocyclaceae bacterium]|nr:MAG: recombinase family protein [Rhodocyclaceae bacterium]